MYAKVLCKVITKRGLLLKGIRTGLQLLLSHFSHVRLCVTPQTAAHQASPFLGFSRQEHWSGLPFPSPMRESEVAQSCPTLSDPMDCSPAGSSVHGIFQARVLEWGAIATRLLGKSKYQTVIPQWPLNTEQIKHYKTIFT